MDDEISMVNGGQKSHFCTQSYSQQPTSDVPGPHFPPNVTTARPLLRGLPQQFDLIVKRLALVRTLPKGPNDMQQEGNDRR